MVRKRHHLLTAIGLLLSTSFLGAAVTFLVARSLLLSAADNRLKSFASDFLQVDDKLADDINSTLRDADASPYEPCSDPDLALQRHLLFRSPFLKDVGRESNNYFVCSAIAGKLPHPRLNSTPSLATPDGKFLFVNTPLRIDKLFHGELVLTAKSDVVLDPNTFNQFHRPPLFFSEAIVDRATHTMLTTYSDAPFQPTLELMLTSGISRRGNILLFSECSPNRPSCVVTGIPMQAIWVSNLTTLISASILGGLIGLAVSGTAVLMDLRRRTLPNQLRRAIRKGDLNVLYQPIVDVRTGAIVSAEALVRWTDEDGDAVRPDLFVSLAEEHGFIGEITIFVLGCVLEELGETLRAHPGFSVSVNMSAQDLTDPSFIPRLDALLRAKRVAASSIGLELTERSTADRDHVIETIRQLRHRGHVVYIDDFGTGFSSLAYLSELNVDVLKVDRAFTRTIGTASVTASILPQILAMAQALNLRIIVEGVELAQQAEYLASIEPSLDAQGWFFGAPLTAAAFKTRLNKPNCY